MCETTGILARSAETKHAVTRCSFTQDSIRVLWDARCGQ